MGREIRMLDETEPIEGRRVQLTINLSMQKAAEEGFRHFGYNGAAIVLEPKNGEVLTFVSVPAYDPNSFAGGIDRATWQALNTDKLLPLQNRAIQGRYSPGSTFKLVVATAALEEGLVTPDFKVHCSGGAVFYGRYFKCHLKGGHGTVSCGTRSRSRATCTSTRSATCSVSIAFTSGRCGSVWRARPASICRTKSRASCRRPNGRSRRPARSGTPGETISVAIGQGQNSVTPTSLAVMMATLANGGTRVIPHLVKAVDEGEGWQPVPPPDNPFKPFLFKPGTIAAIHDGLWMAVNGAGTAGRARIYGRDVAGKTGTAQVISIQGKERAGKTDKDLRDHGWFVFMVPRDNPELAGVIFAGARRTRLSRGADRRHVIETYYAEKEGRPSAARARMCRRAGAPATAIAAGAAAAKPQRATGCTRLAGAGGGR